MIEPDTRSEIIAGLKVSMSWLLSLQANNVAAWLAIVYTAAQLYVLVRDKIVRKRQRRKDAQTTSPGTLS